MNIEQNDEDAEHYDRSMANEVRRAINQIEFGVLAASVSLTLESSDQVAFLNVRTLEQVDYCVELTMRGYMVVGQCFDSVDEELMKRNLDAVRVYETVDSLMLEISPMYGSKFNNSLADKLSLLANMQRD